MNMMICVAGEISTQNFQKQIKTRNKNASAKSFKKAN